MLEFWPKDDIKLSKKTSNPILFDFYNKDIIDVGFFKYASYFNQSAYALANHVLNEDNCNSKLDMWFYPIGFLYRHSLELLLKAIGFKHFVTLDEKKEFITKGFHKLNVLLESLEFLQSVIPKEHIEWLSKFFIEIDKYDSESDSFRYPFSMKYRKTWFYKELEPVSLFKEQTHIDLIKFANKFGTAFNILKNAYNNNHIYPKLKYNTILFEGGGSYHTQCVVGYRYNKFSFYPFVTSYTECANYLFENYKKSKKEFNIVPMMYLFRNALELSLKRLLYEESCFRGEKALILMNKHKHSVYSLWHKLRDNVEEHGQPKEGDETLINVDNYIKMFHDLDPQADKFRYPTNKSLEFHFKKDQKYDLVNLNRLNNDILRFLDGVNAMIGVHNEWEADMEYEYRGTENYNDYY